MRLTTALNMTSTPVFYSRGSRSGSFSIADLFAFSEQGAWYDPSDLSTLFQDSAGTTPVTASGQPVGLMLDKSGNGNHATQAISAKRPIYTEGSGLSWLAFDGVDDAMVTGNIDFTGTDKMSLFVGVRRLTDNTAVLVESSANWNLIDGSLLLFTGTAHSGVGDGFSTAARGSQRATAYQFGATDDTFEPPVTLVLSASNDISGDLSSIRGNGVAGQNGTGEKGAGNFNNLPLFIGARNASKLAFEGNFYGIILRGSLSTAAEISAVEAYLAAKSGVTL